VQARVAGGGKRPVDLLCQEVPLHAAGGLRDFIEVRASKELLDRAGRVWAWPNQPLGLYEYLGLEREVLTIREHRTGREAHVLQLGCASGTGPAI